MRFDRDLFAVCVCVLSRVGLGLTASSLASEPLLFMDFDRASLIENLT